MKRRQKMINIGIIGCGYWGPKHLRNFYELPEANVACVCDLEEDKLRQVRAQYPSVATTTRYGDLLGDSVDAIVVATPAKTHYRLARQALLYNKHVLIEKPITTSSLEALELIELADRRNLVLMVGHTYEYHPAVDYLRQLIKNGELGEIYGIDSDRLNLGLVRPDVNVLWDLAPHDTCIVLSLLDKEPLAVSARGTYHIDPGLCDVAYIELLFPNGTMAHIHVSWLDPRKVRQTTIVGSKKMAIYDDVQETEKIHIYDKGLALSADANGFSSWPLRYRYGDVRIPYINSTEPLRVECGHFLSCIKEGKRPRSDGWAGLRVVQILEAADRSLLNGGHREKLPPLTTMVESSQEVHRG
jgi:predicted dehydrogenase